MSEPPKEKEPSKRRFLRDAVKGGLSLLASLLTGKKLAPVEPRPPAKPEPKLPSSQVPADLKNELDESYEEFRRSNPDYRPES